MIDMASLKVIGEIKAGDHIHGVCVQADGKKLFATVESDQTVKTIDAVTLQIVGVVKLAGNRLIRRHARWQISSRSYPRSKSRDTSGASLRRIHCGTKLTTPVLITHPLGALLGVMSTRDFWQGGPKIRVQVASNHCQKSVFFELFACCKSLKHIQRGSNRAPF